MRSVERIDRKQWERTPTHHFEFYDEADDTIDE